MAFNVSYSAGGTLEEVKRISAILGGVIDQIKVVNKVEGIDLVDVVNNLQQVEEVLNVQVVEAVREVDLVKKIELLERIDTVRLLETVNLLERVNQVDNVSNIESVYEVDAVRVVDEVSHVASIHGFPQFTKPYNTMIKMDIPSIKGVYEETFITPDIPVEMVALTVTCSGYGELDKYDLYCNGELWFKDWYLSEVKEGLFLGTSTIVYYLPPNSELKVVFHNDSGTSKICWFGIRMLVEETTNKNLSFKQGGHNE